MDKYAKMALDEYNSEACAVHPGGVNGRLFWNINSSQFTFSPSFQFPWIPAAGKYEFIATDKNGVEHRFTADTPTANLAPIWGEIPTGFVELKVVSSSDKLVGARTFFKLEPFPGRENLPKRARSYREAALMSYNFIYSDDIVNHWLTHGVPKPDYAHNAYPSKMLGSIIPAMTKFAESSPENRENALKLAKNAADYLISISFPKGHPLEGLPPTYSFDGLDADVVNEVAPAAQKCLGTIMMIYPVSAGAAYLELYKATKDEKYLNAALKIAEFYKNNIRPEGSWFLLYDCESGKPLKKNLCLSFQFVSFFEKLCKVTDNADWQNLSKAHYEYVCDACLKNFNWEGQFEDIPVTGNYHNLTHFAANNMIDYIVNNLSDDESQVLIAKDLMRYVEDQFVVWGEFPNWEKNPPTNVYHTPCGLEQYLCYCPIDSSTARIIESFMMLYKMTGERLYLEKAMALADNITRMQDEATGLIPTFFIGENCSYGRFNYWINCHIHTTGVLMELAELTEKEGIE